MGTKNYSKSIYSLLYSGRSEEEERKDDEDYMEACKLKNSYLYFKDMRFIAFVNGVQRGYLCPSSLLIEQYRFPEYCVDFGLSIRSYLLHNEVKEMLENGSCIIMTKKQFDKVKKIMDMAIASAEAILKKE